MADIEKRTFSLPSEHTAFIDSLVSSGTYASGSEVVRAGLRALQERDAAVEQWLREEVAIWQRELPRVAGSLVVRYEDMRADPAAALRRVLAFLGTPGTEEQIADAVAYASYDNMKQLEQKKVFWLSGTRLAAADQANPQSYKVRRAKVGGWRDYFTDQETAAIDAVLAARPMPPFSYGAAAPARQRA